MKYLLPLIIFVWLGKPGAAQDQFFRVVKDYFRVDPFAGQFSAFVNAVKTDPNLKTTVRTDKTDTSLFAVQGTYQSFNPFTIRANRVEMLLAEKQRVIQAPRPLRDTMVLYQITGFFDSTAQTFKALKREYKRINKKLKPNLPVYEEASLNNIAGIGQGAITNHALHSASTIAPISIAWYVTREGELALMLVLRLKYSGNRAYPYGLPIGYDYYLPRNFIHQY